MNIYQMKKPKTINSVSVSMVVAGLVLAYLLYWWVPILWPIFRMTGIMKAACNEAYQDYDDQRIMKKLLRSSVRTGLPLTKDNFRFRRVPYTLEEMKARKIESDSFLVKRGKICEIDFRYRADYPIPFTGRTMFLQFDRSVSAPLVTVEYTKLCTCVTVPSNPTVLVGR